MADFQPIYIRNVGPSGSTRLSIGDGIPGDWAGSAYSFYGPISAGIHNRQFWYASVVGGNAASGTMMYAGGNYAGYHFTTTSNQVARSNIFEETELWAFTDFTGNPRDIVADARFVYVPMDDGPVYKLNSITGAEVWEFTGFGGFEVRGIAVDSDGFVYAGANTGDLKKISPGGDEVWTIDASRGESNYGIGTLTLMDGYLYVGLERTGEAPLIEKRTLSGTLLWTNSLNIVAALGHEVEDIEVGADGHVYGCYGVASIDPGYLRKIDSEGTTVWTTPEFTNQTCIGATVDNATNDVYCIVQGVASAIKKFNSAGGEDWSTAIFQSPRGIQFCDDNNTIYVVGDGFNDVEEYNTSGVQGNTYNTTAGSTSNSFMFRQDCVVAEAATIHTISNGQEHPLSEMGLDDRGIPFIVGNNLDGNKVFLFEANRDNPRKASDWTRTKFGPPAGMSGEDYLTLVEYGVPQILFTSDEKVHVFRSFNREVNGSVGSDFVKYTRDLTGTTWSSVNISPANVRLGDSRLKKIVSGLVDSSDKTHMLIWAASPQTQSLLGTLYYATDTSGVWVYHEVAVGIKEPGWREAVLIQGPADEFYVFSSPGDKYTAGEGIRHWRSTDGMAWTEGTQIAGIGGVGAAFDDNDDLYVVCTQPQTNFILISDSSDNGASWNTGTETGGPASSPHLFFNF